MSAMLRLPSLAPGLAVLALAVVSPAQSAAQGGVEARRNEAMIECAQRHLELGLWCRDKGLVREATTELLRADALAEGRHAGVRTVLGYMRRLDEAFWKKRARPSPSATKSYPKRAEEALRDDERDRLRLARWAADRGMVEQAHEEYVGIVRVRGDALEIDGEGNVVIGTGPLPEEVSERLLAESIVINRKVYLRDELLKHLPDVGEIWEVESSELRVRSTGSEQSAAEMHALASALLPILEEDFGGRPTGRLDLFLIDRRADYVTWVNALGLPAYAIVSGFADLATECAVVCREGKGAETLQSLVLHELTHLYELRLSRASMPEWYREGVAEQFGGAGTFVWDAESRHLETGGPLAEEMCTALKKSPGTVAQVLRFDPLAAWQEGLSSGKLGYARCWALVRYLRSAAPAPVRERFVGWVDQCYGAGLGAVAAKQRNADPTEARKRFDEMMGEYLEELERGYAAFVAGL